MRAPGFPEPVSGPPTVPGFTDTLPRCVESSPRRGGAALGRLHRASNPGRGWLAPEAVRLVREALQGVLDGLARKPPVVGTLAAGRVKDALAVLPEEG